VAGMLVRDEVQIEARRVLVSGGFTQCLDQASQVILKQIGQAPDVLSDAARQPQTPCEVISIGLEFAAERATLGDVAAPQMPLADPCDGI
jgi:hypothetical protein